MSFGDTFFALSTPVSRRGTRRTAAVCWRAAGGNFCELEAETTAEPALEGSMTWPRALRASKLGAEQHNKGRLDMFTPPPKLLQGGLFGWLAAFLCSRGNLSVLCVEGTLLEGRDSVVWRARDGVWGECLQGDGTNSFCRRACNYAVPCPQ